MDCTRQRPVAGQMVYRAVLRAALALLVSLGIFGCKRKAPGPDECRALAQKVVLWEANHGVPARPAVENDALVRKCLTTPFDRALVECVNQGKSPEDCRGEYARRVEQGREERGR